MTRNPLLAFLLVALVGLGTPFLVARQPAGANGVPQLVKLEYLEGLSNWGPEDAQGILEFSFAEAYARVDVKDLVPEPGYTYEGWLLNDNGNVFLVGGIAIAASGIGALETSLDGLDRYDYNLFFIAGRTAADVPGIPPSTLSIGGSFTVISTPADGTDAGDTRPQVLPDTGEAATQSPFSRGLMAMAAMTATGIIIIFVSRLRRKGTTND